MDRSSFLSRLKKSDEITKTFKSPNLPTPHTDPTTLAVAQSKSTMTSLMRSGAGIQGSSLQTYALNLIHRPPSTLGLTAYSGDINNPSGNPTYALVSHLLKRACFNASPKDILSLVNSGMSMQAIVDSLFNPYPIPPPPVNPTEIQTDSTLPNYNPTGDFIGSTIASPYNANLESQRNSLVFAQWNNLILNSPINIREKFVVFLSSLLVEIQGSINDARFFYGYLNLLRTYANNLNSSSPPKYSDLIKQLVIDPGMLVYLNGAGSLASAPNENFARELQELFTIGKGPETARGDYTNYSEQDVQAAAKVLTGWNVTGYQSTGPVTAVFNLANHDTSTKQFSNDYGNATIANNGPIEYADLIDLIFKQKATATYLATRLYREYIYYHEDSVIVSQLADLIITNGYNLLPVLKTLLSSQYFFDAYNIGSVIKDPISLTAGLYRNLELLPPSGSSSPLPDAIAQASNLSMSIGNPDQVAGWKATYETPDFSEWWINSITMANRVQFTDNVVKSNPNALIALVLNYVSQFKSYKVATVAGDPSDPDDVINSLAYLFFPYSLGENSSDYSGPISSDQHDLLKGILLPGLLDFEWNAQIWGPYQTGLSSPGGPSQAIINVLSGRLIGLFQYMLSMAEYHLS